MLKRVFKQKKNEDEFSEYFKQRIFFKKNYKGKFSFKKLKKKISGYI